jgi:hypothetical protein
MRALPIGAWLALGGLALLWCPPAGAQVQSAEDLIDRIRQIQAEQQAPSQPSGQPAPAALQPELGEDEIRTIVADSLGVEILRVEVVEHAGEPVYAITVMNPPGNRNDAFRVATLLFDGATGALLGQQPPVPRTAASGPPSPPAARNSGAEGLDIRRRTWR